MPKQGFVLKVNGEEVYSTDEPVNEIRLRSERGEVVRFGGTDPHVIELNYHVSSEFNRHLDLVDADRREANRARVEETGATGGDNTDVSRGEGVSEDQPSVVSSDESDSPSFGFSDDDNETDESNE